MKSNMPSLPTIPSGGAIQDIDENNNVDGNGSDDNHRNYGVNLLLNKGKENDENHDENDSADNPHDLTNDEEKKDELQNVIATSVSISDKGNALSKLDKKIMTKTKKKKDLTMKRNRKHHRHGRRRKVVTIEHDCSASYLTVEQNTKSLDTSQDPKTLSDIIDENDDVIKVTNDWNQYQRKSVLPQDQYECILRRRAIIKEEDRIKHMSSRESLSSSDSSLSSSSQLIISSPQQTPSTNPKRRVLFSKFTSNHKPSATPLPTSPTRIRQKSSQNEAIDMDVQSDYDEIYGETTLGLKLTIISGKVIVENIIPLNDGRASPAQLSGLIKKGDVLLCINDKSLSCLPFENVNTLVDRLAPLSHPSSEDRLVYDREVKIRFQIGDGMKLLEKNNKKKKEIEDIQTNLASQVDGANDLFNLSRFTFVDQLSGKPLFFDEEVEQLSRSESQMSAATSNVISNEIISKDVATPKVTNESKQISSPTLLRKTKSKNPAYHNFQSEHQSLERRLFNIGYACSIERMIDVVAYSSSGFFLLNKQCSTMLGQQINHYQFNRSLKENDDYDNMGVLNSKEKVNLGNRVLLGVKLLMDHVEYESKRKKKIDPIKIVHDECRSFSSRSRFSQRSRRSQNRNFLLLHHDNIKNEIDNESSASSSACSDDSGSLGPQEMIENNVAGGDEVLLRLAAWNRSWKEQMKETIDSVSLHRVESGDEQKSDRDIKESESKTISKADKLELQLQNLFFGKQVIEVLNTKRSSSLPPDEITEVLYDLALSVSATVPMNVEVMGQINASFTDNTFAEHTEDLSPRLSSKRNSEIYEGTKFLLHDIIPSWLNTFRPLQISQRRVLWPLNNRDGNGSIATPDDLSVGSSVGGWSNGSPEKRETLEKRIVSIELDPDTRAET